jgi:triphosphoribosyl-dephospho-CoA synthetase
MNSSDMLFAADGLWTMSAVRFFLLEDLMRLHKFNHLLHIEGDNLLFGKVGINTIPYLRKGYPRLAATILAPHLATASVLWVGELPALSDFNDWLLTLALNNTKSLTSYIDWLWPR